MSFAQKELAEMQNFMLNALSMMQKFCPTLYNVSYLPTFRKSVHIGRLHFWSYNCSLTWPDPTGEEGSGVLSTDIDTYVLRSQKVSVDQTRGWVWLKLCLNCLFCLFCIIRQI